MPSRLLREGILDSEAVNKLTPVEEVFYRRLMSVVDDYGRFDGRPAVLRSRLYPLKDAVRVTDIPRLLAACEKAGLIAVYQVDSKPYILFGKLGTPRNAKSKFPDPPVDVEKRIAQLAIENGCFQLEASVPGSGSGSGSNTGTSSGARASPPDDLALTDAFEAFWNEYPRKAERDETLAEYRRVIRSGVKPIDIMAGLKKWKDSTQWRADNGKFIKYPKRFLSGRLWECNPNPEPIQTPPAGFKDKPDSFESAGPQK